MKNSFKDKNNIAWGGKGIQLVSSKKLAGKSKIA